MSTVELALSASGPTALCALRLADGRVVEGPTAGPTRGTDLIPTIAALLADHHLAAGDIGRLRVDVGPGSYTGLRVAVTFARTTAAFTGARLGQLTSLELLAWAAWARGGVDRQQELTVVLDARRERFHVAAVRLVDGVVTLTSAPAAVDLPTLGAALSKSATAGTSTVLAEVRLHDALRPLCGSLLSPTPVCASDLLEPALATRDVGVDAIEPLYLMATYAD